ncbi:MAG: transhydrogenase (Re/Si-specific) subunit alpha [Rhodospirillales bacterium]|nr:transhydrogenase (Re/Si-specific) subunit alpha [Rhodospirillales bacterium]
MKLAVPKERRANEKRVAAVPETVKKLVAAGFDVIVERGAGEGASIPDSAYEAAGAVIGAEETQTLGGADIVLKVQRPLTAAEGTDEISMLKPGALLISILDPFKAPDALRLYAERRIDTFAMELMPRITRAQTMDVLSSQSNLAGYKAVLDAASEFNRAFPMMMTAAGTVPPAKVFIMGSGVAGLQALATARRLGAVVSATDVRAAAAEQVKSLGAAFIMVESEETKAAETAGGYAKEMSEDYKRRQAELIAETIKKQDIVITTALIPGRKAPVLVSDSMLRTMKPGSVLVDLAVEQGGNVEGSVPGQIVEKYGVKIVGHANVPSRLATDASALYARNLFAFVATLVDKTTKQISVDWSDELVKATCLTRGGVVVHPQFALDNMAPAPATPAPSVSPETPSNG